MRYKLYQPPPALKNEIRYFWTLEGDPAEMTWAGIKLIPDGHLEITFNFGTPVTQRTLCQKTQRPDAFLGGMYPSAFFIEPTGYLQMMGAAFLPGKIQHFISLPVADFCAKNVALHDIDTEWARLYEQLAEAVTVQERLKRLQEYLIGQLQGASRMHPGIHQAIEWMFASRGNIPVGKLAKQVYMSERNFRRLFLGAVGMNPKKLSGILRIRHLVDRFEQNKTASLTQLAYESGYFDQSHFIRDFQQIAGETPGSYFSGLIPDMIRS
ncbi:MAG: helix-turn-helix domain-containing protein [Saprospiraceae bacterium]|nr:helix-turn-helix domain-containing protein [Saprospiraceae bacterium]